MLRLILNHDHLAGVLMEALGALCANCGRRDNCPVPLEGPHL